MAFNVEGNPPPEVTWKKGFKDLKVEPRYKVVLVLLDDYQFRKLNFCFVYHFQMWSKGGLEGENLVILGINQCRSEEEGVGC